MSRKVILAPAKPKDVQFLYELYSNSQIMRGHGLHQPITAMQWRDMVDHFIPGWEHQFLITRGVVYLGHCGLQDWSKEDRRAEIIVSVLPDQWNRGIATAACDDLLDFAMTAPTEGGLGIEMVHAGVFEENPASLRLFERLGFAHVGDLPGFYRYGPRRYKRILLCKEGLRKDP